MVIVARASESVRRRPAIGYINLEHWPPNKFSIMDVSRQRYEQRQGLALLLVSSSTAMRHGRR
jgi:hypothetical protein